MTRRILMARYFVCAATLALPSLSGAQVVPIAGDGRVHIPSALEVGFAPLKPNEVTTINVHPLLGTVLVFPYKVQAAPIADDGTFTANAYENTVLLATKTCAQGCATMLHVFLNDGDLTSVPFLLVVDTLQPPTLKRNFSDPTSARIRTRESEIAAAYEAKAQTMVTEQLESAVERCIATGFAFRPVERANAWRDEATGESIGLTVQDIGFSGRCLERPRLYVRYRVANARYSEARDVKFTVVRRLNTRRTDIPVSLVADRRDPLVIPPLRDVRGELILDGTFDMQPGESLLLRAVIDGHVIDVGVILSAPERRP
jgi:hypothetical protein